MSPVPSVALLKFDNNALLPTELYRMKSLNMKAPEPIDFRLASEDYSSAKNYYRHFKNDLLLTKSKLESADGADWEMKTAKGPSSIGEFKDEKKTPFNSLDVTAVFLEKVCHQAVRRVRDLFGKEQKIRVHFTAPNYAFEETDRTVGKQMSQVYRRNLRRAVDQFKEGRPFKNTTFMTGGYDFLYEPYAVFYYYSILEHSVELAEDQAGKTYLVFDMGGSTTDISLVQVNLQESDFRLYPVCRSIRCAGAYFDRYVLGNLLGYDQTVRRDAKKWNQTLEEIERAKIALCEGKKDTAEINIEGASHKLTRDKLGKLLRDLWKNDNLRLGPAFRGFIGEVRSLVKEHGQLLAFNEIEKVFLAGGSIGLPGIEDLIREDLERLNLLGESELSCVRAELKNAGGEAIAPSSLAALGFSASIAEINTDYLLEELKDVFVQLRGADGKQYIFPRKQKPESTGENGEDDTLLLNINEFKGTDKLSLGYSDESDRELKIHRMGNESYPEHADLYVRAGANPYPNEPQCRFEGRNEPLNADPGEAYALSLSCVAERKGSPGVKLRPALWYRLKKTDKADRYHDDVDPIHISLKREQAEADVHVCIDFGMNNTSVAVHAPHRAFPENSEDLEIFYLDADGSVGDPKIAVPERAFILQLLATESLPLQESVEALASCFSSVETHGYPAVYRQLARGAHATCYIQGAIRINGSAPDEAVSAFVDVLQEVEGRSVDAAQVHGEVDAFRRLLHLHDSDVSSIAQWLRQQHQQLENLKLDHVWAAVKDVRPAPWPEPDTPPETTIPEDDMKPPPSEQKNGAAKVAAAATEHWTEGFAKWIDQRIQNSTAPLQQSTDKVNDAVERLAEVAEALTSAGDSDSSGEDMEKALQRAIVPLNEPLREIAASLKAKKSEAAKKGSENARSFDERISALMEDPQHPLAKAASEEKSFKAFKAFIAKKKLIYPEKVLRQVWTRCVSGSGPLIILAGPPGSGKTSLVRLMAEFFNRDVTDAEDNAAWNEFYHLQPVSPSWFSPEDLLGSFSILNEQFQDTPFLRFLTKAECHYYETGGSDNSRLFFACLDEFNIAQPEQYLADILSKMESPVSDGSQDRIIHLCSGEQLSRNTDLTIELTPNIRLFATINTDISTKTLSPKVLDRSFFLRLTPGLEELQQVTEALRERYPVAARFHEVFRDEVLPFIDRLARAGQSPLGFRMIEQAYAYSANHPKLANGAPKSVIDEVMGEVLTGFFLPKLPGAFSIDDPEATYEGLLQNGEVLRTFKGVDQVLTNIRNGLPGQAAL